MKIIPRVHWGNADSEHSKEPLELSLKHLVTRFRLGDSISAVVREKWRDDGFRSVR